MPSHRSARRTASTPDTAQRGRDPARRQGSQRQRRARSKRTRRETRRGGQRRRVGTRVKNTAALYRRPLKRFIEVVFGSEGALHHKQVASLFMVSVGVLHAAYLGVAAVGKAMALAFGTKVKHGIKQVDRFLSNDKLPMTDVFQHLIPALVGCRSQVQVSMDWTEFDADDHSTISLSLITGGKRTLPLCWLTVKKSKLKGTQRTWEAIALMHLRRAVPKAVEVVIVADRGFGDVELYNFIRSLDFHFLIRYRQAIYVHHQGHPQPCSTLVPRRGQVRVIRQAYLTRRRVGPFTVVLCKAAGMKEPWCLATSLESLTGRRVVRIYSRRFQCEETFRDLKDPRYGYGLRLTKIADGARRDRCILVFTLTYVIQTLFGVSSESIGLDKTLRANTVKRRTHSLFRQGRSLLGNLDHLTYAALAKRVAVVFNLLLARGILEAIP